jgi:ArsR family transcriptional regulator
MIKVLKALADESRLRILQLLLDQELCVCEIETVLDMNQSNVSRHLSKLKQAGIVEFYKGGQWVHYKVSSNFIVDYESLLDQLSIFFKSEESFQRDFDILKKYNVLGFKCTDIRKDVDAVKLKIMEG